MTLRPSENTPKEAVDTLQSLASTHGDAVHDLQLVVGVNVLVVGFKIVAAKVSEGEDEVTAVPDSGISS